MSGRTLVWEQPDRSAELAREVDRNVRISDFALMAILPFRIVAIDNYPVNEFAMAALVGLCLFRSGREGAKPPFGSVAAFLAFFALLIFSGTANDIDWARRVAHIAVMVGLVWALGTGRVSLRSAGLGLAAGLVTVITLALAGVGGNTYPGRLTGFLGDPNAGAYFIATLGVLAIFFCDGRWRVRLVVAVPIVAGLMLTYSRTGLLAGAFAVIWVLLGRRLGSIGGAALAGGLVWLVSNIPEDLTTFGPFSNRSGSDALRKRIIAQEQVQLADMPWYGHGPGTAKVDVRGQEFFFHNSYLAVRHEAGWLALVFIVALLMTAFFKASASSRGGDLAATAAQAAIIAVAVMSITLGEVLLETPLAIAVGFALGQLLRTADSDPDPAGRAEPGGA